MPFENLRWVGGGGAVLSGRHCFLGIKTFYTDSCVRYLFLETSVGAQGQSLKDRILINTNVYVMKRGIEASLKMN